MTATLAETIETPATCPLLTAEDLICGVTGTTTCTTDPAKQAKCPKC